MSTTTKQFYLLGESPSTARDIEVPANVDYAGLQYLIASRFAIVEPQGVGFVSQDLPLMLAAEVLSSPEPVAISIDGKPVREIPGPEGLPYVGNYFEIYPDHLGNHQRLFDTYGPLFKTTNFGRVVYNTNDPKIAALAFCENDFWTKSIIDDHPLHPIKIPEAGLFLGDTDSEEWRSAHKFLPPALGPKAVRHYAPSMQKTVEDSFRVFDELDERGEAWNVYPYMLKLASQSIGKLILGMDFAHFDTVDTELHVMVRCIAGVLELNKIISSMGTWFSKIPFGPTWKLAEVMERIRQMIKVSIENAAKGGTEDLPLQEAALAAKNVVDYVIRAVDNKGNKLDQKKLVEPLVVVTAAGFTTTSGLLSWLVYQLVAQPEMQERLLQELIDNDFDENTQLDADYVAKLTFLDKYVKETLRRNDPAYQPARTSKIDMILPGGYKFPKDGVVITALHHIHNNPEIWENPTRFDPDRWDTDAVKNRPNGAYVPFATGPRGCIGFNFALMEVKIFIAKLVYRYQFTLAKEGPIEYDPLFQLIQPNNLYVRAEKRVKWPHRSDL